MQTDWASENLQVIRTLMERAAIYRRAMAPIMVVVGVTGIAAGFGGTCLNSRGFVLLNSQTARGFVLFWLAVALVCLLEAFFMIRRQALKDSDPVWSPPTRRAAQSVSPAFLAALMLGLFFLDPRTDFFFVFMLIPAWMTLYGLAMHSAGFFMLRGFKLFGWGFVLGAVFFVGFLVYRNDPSLLRSSIAANLAMGGFFGGGHLAYGFYLYFTEKRGNVA
jgi:hypothetical protein